MLTAKEAEATLKAEGMERISVAELDRRLESIGYRRDMDSACVGPVRCMTTGVVYTGINYNPMEIDTRMSFAHFQARRDARFRELKEIRRRVFCVVRGRILTI